jgi:DNA-binding FrmR family transcriptional regulator
MDKGTFMDATKPIRSISECTQSEVLLRLRRIEGQVRGIQRMVEENRECRDVVVQLAAVKASIASLNTLVAETYAQECLCGGEQLDTSEVGRLLDLLKAAR